MLAPMRGNERKLHASEEIERPRQTFRRTLPLHSFNALVQDWASCPLSGAIQPQESVLPFHRQGVGG